MKRSKAVMSLSILIVLVACQTGGGPNLNFAAAFGWRGHVDTDLAFSEFFTGDHTVMARFMLQYPKAYAGPMLAAGASGSYFIGQAPVSAAGAGLLLTVPGGTATYTLGNALAAGRWYHLAVVRSGSTFRLYLDGQRRDLDGCTAAPCDLVATGGSMPGGRLRLGRLADGSNLVGHEAQFYGLLDDVAVFDRALSGGQIGQIVGRPRLLGTEADLLAGWTFDSQTPLGGALPAQLARPVTFHSPADQGVGYEGVGALLPAQRVLVSQQRDDTIDAGFMLPQFQQVELRLPFPKGEAWVVGQGWQNTAISHNGRAAFAWDFNLAGQPLTSTAGKPAYAAAGGSVIEVQDGRGCGVGYPANYVMVEHAPAEIGAYLHFVNGSLQVGQTDQVAAGTYLADTGDTGNTGCGSFHLHFGLHNLPESQAGSLVTFPAAFSHYEASEDGGLSWYPVTRGVPSEGQWVRTTSGNTPPVLQILTPANNASYDYGGLHNVTFKAAVSDLEDGGACCSVGWSSDKDGALGNGVQLDHVFASPGARVITAKATDSNGATSQATISLTIGNSPPSAEIVVPGPGQNLYRDIPYVLQGQIQDFNELLGDLCSSASWTSSEAGDPGLLGCNPQVTFTTTGTRTLTFTATDAYGLQGNDSVAISVIDPPLQGPPLVTILEPSDGTLLYADSSYTLRGTATDPDGKTPLSYEWTVKDYFGSEHSIAMGSYDPAIRGSQIIAQWTPSDQVPFSCGGGPVEVFLYVTDPDSETGADRIEVYVLYPVC